MNVKKVVILIITLFFFLLIIAFPTCIYAVSSFSSINVEELDLSRLDQNKIDTLKSTIEALSQELNPAPPPEATESPKNEEDEEEININEVLKIYSELSKVLSNKDLEKFIEDNTVPLSNAGFSQDLLDLSIKLFRTFDADTIIEIAKQDLNANKIFASYQKGDSIDEIAISIIDNTSISTSIKIAIKLLFANGFFRLIFMLFIVVAIYSVIVTGFIFKKADKKIWSTAIPIYRDIIHLRLCNFSPWLLLLVFIPFIGWLALMSIAVIRKI